MESSKLKKYNIVVGYLALAFFSFHKVDPFVQDRSLRGTEEYLFIRINPKKDPFDSFERILLIIIILKRIFLIRINPEEDSFDQDKFWRGSR